MQRVYAVDIRAISNLNRFREIIAVLVKYGFNDIADRLRFPARRFLGKIKPDVPTTDGCEKLRHAFEELGPTFVKFGQLLSLRVDLFPQEFLEEFRKLQDQVEPVSYAKIKQAIEAEFNNPLEQIFSSFALEPIAAGSLAQVHKAVLKSTGDTVAVKVRRPAILKYINKDLHILETIAPFLEEHFELAKAYNLTQMVIELKHALLREINFQHEAQHMKIVADNFLGDSFVHIPRLYDQFCTEAVLTMELVDGCKISAIGQMSLAQRKELGEKCLHSILKQILEDGFFHADPHPGNFLLLRDNSLCILDWGIVGLLNNKMRADLAEFIEAATVPDSESVVELLLRIIEFQPEKLMRQWLQRDVRETLSIYHNLPLGKINVRQLFIDINSILCFHRLKIPADLTLMLKALITAEGTVRIIDPDLCIAEQVHPYVRKILTKRWQPKELLEKLRKTVLQLSILHRDLPLRLHQLLEKLENGKLSVRLQHKNIGEFKKTVERTANKLSVSLIISALIIGSSMIITTGIKPLFMGYPVISLCGYLISAIMGGGLLLNIWGGKK